MIPFQENAEEDEEEGEDQLPEGKKFFYKKEYRKSMVLLSIISIIKFSNSRLCVSELLIKHESIKSSNKNGSRKSFDYFFIFVNQLFHTISSVNHDFCM